MTNNHPADDRHSRSRRAGYDPEVLFDAKALLVGAGALGQNLAQDLALAGVGTITVVDDDDFEDHNRTRSPYFPTPEILEELGPSKAKIVAHGAHAQQTAPTPTATFIHDRVQAYGDALIESATIVFAAVDNPAARAYLADRARLHRTPLVEGGFEGHLLTCGVFDPDPATPCYRCHAPSRVGAFSCQHYAHAAEAQRIIPAIQNAAAVLAGFMAEQGILQMHGQAPLSGKRAFVDLRAPSLRVAQLLVNPDCDGVHEPFLEIADLDVTPDELLTRLLTEIRARFGPADLRLPEPLVVRIPCPECGELAEPLAPEWKWLTEPRCHACGGSFPRARMASTPSSFDVVSTESTVLPAVSCRGAGLAGRALVEIFPHGGPKVLGRLPETA